MKNTTNTRRAHTVAQYICTILSFIFLFASISVFAAGSPTSDDNTEYSYAPFDRPLEEIVSDTANASSVTSWYKSQDFAIDAESVWNLIVPVAKPCDDMAEVGNFNLYIAYDYVVSNYGTILREILLVNTETCQVEVIVKNSAPNDTYYEYYRRVYEVSPTVMNEVINICEAKWDGTEEEDKEEQPQELTVKLTNEIRGNLVLMARNHGLTVGEISYEDIYNVYYEQRNYYQSALQIISLIQVSDIASSRAQSYIAKALEAKTWEEMRENLVKALRDYAIDAFKTARKDCMNSFAAELVYQSFKENVKNLDVMDMAYYTLWMESMSNNISIN